MSPNRKLLSLEQLLEVRRRARQEGKTVVQCHGCFDIVHPGHIQHLQFARSLGDVLIVSITADSHVSKGINRPLIPDDLRAAGLGALECVDWVYVNQTSTAVDLLEELQPDVYVKGQEYEKNKDPRFLAERQTVERHGGRVVFSSGDIVYSSTALINGLDEPEYFNEEKLRRFRQQYGLSGTSLHNLVSRFRGQRVLVIGDYILDRYHLCDATGVASEGPMMTLRLLRSQDFDGGAGVIALHAAALGASPTLFTLLADDEPSKQIEMRLRSAGVEVQSLPQRRQIVAKHRYMVDQSKLFKVDEGAKLPLDSRSEQILSQRILAAAEGAAAVILADFGYGLMTEGLLERIMPELRRQVPVITADISGREGNLLRFKQVDLVCPTEREVRENLNDFASSLPAVVSEMLRRTSARQAMITLGKQGLVMFDQPPQVADAPAERLRSEYLPALSTHAVDPIGCGDALLATASLALAAGGSLQAAGLLGSVAASIEVQQLGNHPVTAERLMSRLFQQEPATARMAS